jgi:hypothetical protein
MWRVQPSLWNSWVNTFPRKRIHATIEELFSARSVPRGCKKDKEDCLRQSSFETPACQVMNLGSEELNWGIRIIECSSVELKVWLWREDFTCAIVPRHMECVTQWDSCSSFVKIHCQETDSGDCNRLRTLVFAAVKCKVRRFAVLYITSNYELSV